MEVFFTKRKISGYIYAWALDPVGGRQDMHAWVWAVGHAAAADVSLRAEELSVQLGTHRAVDTPQ